MMEEMHEGREKRKAESPDKSRRDSCSLFWISLFFANELFLLSQ